MTVKRLAVVVPIVLILMQVVYLLIPVSAIGVYNITVQPLIFLMLAASVFVFIGRDSSFTPKRKESVYAVCLGMLSFGILFLIMAVPFGTGRNVLTQNSSVVLRNLWEVGFIVFLGEYIRYKIIKHSPRKNMEDIVFFLTIALAIPHMGGVRMLFEHDVMLSSIFFESIFRPIVISVVASYFVVKQSSFRSVFAISFFFTMVPYLLPIVLDTTPLVWTLFICFTAVVAAFICRFAVSDKDDKEKVREKKYARYAPKSFTNIAIVSTVLLTLTAFFLGAFPIYPVVILTDSMEGTFNRGSIVFVERTRPEEVYYQVGEGYVIHFRNRNRVEYIHRVVDFRLDADGMREYVTQGDAEDYRDPYTIPQGDVIGIARAHMPIIGYPVVFVRNLFRSNSQ